MAPPSRSLRPQPRVTPRERRAREHVMAEHFAALEARADMDPLLVNDPLRRLGYRQTGGLQGLIFSRDPNTAQYRNRHRLIDIGGNFFADPVVAHEAGHAGFDFVSDAIAADPDLLARFIDAGFIVDARPEDFEAGSFPVSSPFEEAVVELGDDPSATWNLPRNLEPGLFSPGQKTATMEETIDYLDRVSGAERARLSLFNDIMQRVAEDELRRRGEPPRAQMREPGPENMFYREPEVERGIGALFRRLFGRD